MTNLNFIETYTRHVEQLVGTIKGDDALKQAIGGEFIAVGKLEFYLLVSLGLKPEHHVVDVGCGSGRLASQLAGIPGLKYTGLDIMDPLLKLAKRLCNRPDWTFGKTSGRHIPMAEKTADFVCFFSVFTHLLHEETFLYLEEAFRVLRPGGMTAFSFLEFRIPCHWEIFFDSVKNIGQKHLNQFVDRDGITMWAERLGFEVVSIHDGDKPHIPIPEEVVWENGNRMSGSGNLGQSVAVLRKP